jgi:hypothetical protein
MNRADAIRKIRACLALAKSPFPEEAARAMSQAQALMQRFAIEQPDLLAAGVQAHWTKSRASKRPPAYEAMLANIVADQFGCQLLFARQLAGGDIVGGYNFIAPGTAAEVAAYSFEVLARQLVKARAEYTKTNLARYRKNKVAAADQFCVGWVHAVMRNSTAPAPNAEHAAAITAYMAKEYTQVGKLATTKRDLANPAVAQLHGAQGWVAGRQAKVNAGIASNSHPLQLAAG